MIIIANKQIEAADLSSEYPAGSIERVIIYKLAESNEKYRYDSLEELKFEFDLRKKIIQAARDLNKSNFGFEVFREARCNEDYWELTDEGGFVLKEGVKPSDAISDIFTNSHKYGTECATAMVIVYYKALLDIYGEELFNSVFPNIHLMNWRYIDKNLKEIGISKIAKDFFPGDRRYFSNPDVNPLTPEWQGENTIDLGDGFFYGHGIGIENEEAIISALNKNRKEGAERSAYLLGSVGRPNFKRLADIYFRSNI